MHLFNFGTENIENVSYTLTLFTAQPFTLLRDGEQRLHEFPSSTQERLTGNNYLQITDDITSSSTSSVHKGIMCVKGREIPCAIKVMPTALKETLNRSLSERNKQLYHRTTLATNEVLLGSLLRVFSQGGSLCHLSLPFGYYYTKNEGVCNAVLREPLGVRPAIITISHFHDKFLLHNKVPFIPGQQEPASITSTSL